MTRQVEVCSVDEIAEGAIRRADIDSTIIAIYNIGGAFYATDAYCTHDRVDLALEGELQGDVVECPAHFGQFHVPTGAPRARPCLIPLQTYKVVLKDDKVWIEL